MANMAQIATQTSGHKKRRMDMIWTIDFWRGCGERALRTFFQTFVALIGVGAAGFQDVDWLLVLSGSGLASLLSVATSIASADFVAGAPYVEIEEL